MIEKLDINFSQLFKDFNYLLKTPGPTQACVKISETDPRTKKNFPIENAVQKIVEGINKRENLNLRLIRHMSNLLVVSEKLKHEEMTIIDERYLDNDDVKKIKKIKIIFGAHLDEISYIITRKRSFLKDENFEILPLCNPPKLTSNRRITDKSGRKFAKEIYHPDCKIVGFRNGNFYENIGQGLIYKVFKINEEKSPVKIDIDGEKEIREFRPEDRYLLLKVLTKKQEIKPGDIVIQDYGDWKEKKTFENPYQIIRSKAIDDRLGCIAAIYAVKELAKRGINSKAILTSAEEGLPNDISWGRLVRPTYERFCTHDTLTLICDGADGKELKEFEDEDRCLSSAVIIPYTSFGKGGGDLGIFSRFRDDIIPKLKEIYEEDVAVTTTDYVSRSYEIKIMDDYTAIGFIQWSCGKPLSKTSICHNDETVCFYQLVNIIRTMCHSFDFFSKKIN